MNQQSIDRLERGIHGYFPLGRARRIGARQGFDEADWDAFATLEDLVDQALPGRRVRPGTRCTEAEHSRFYGRVGRGCKQGQTFSCRGTDSVNEMYAKAAIAHDCANARFTYQRRCFSRAHPDWVGHEIQRAQARRAARTCWEMARARGG